VLLAFLMALSSYLIALMVEIISLYMVSLMTDIIDVIQNFIQFEIILIFSEKAINLYNNSPLLLAMEPLVIANFKKDKRIVAHKEDVVP
jgi:hypothetical protein